MQKQVVKCDAEAVAAAIIKESNRVGIPITNLRLSKLLFLAQAMSLTTFDRPLFDEEFEAWNYGPVQPLVYQKYSYLGIYAIEDRVVTRFVMNWNETDVYKMGQYIEYEQLDAESMELVKKIVSSTKKYSDFDLIKILSECPPWKDAFDRKNIHKIISKESIKKYYKLLNPTSSVKGMNI